MNWRRLLRPKTLVMVAGGGLLVALIFGLSFWVLISPANPLTSLFRDKISITDAPVITGPYPIEADFELLRAHNVKTIVSLLDPNLPYEKVLLDRERRLAAIYKMEVLNFPMTSLFGKSFGDDYQDNARQAADAIEQAQKRGKVFLHCYLGLHRAKNVQQMLVQRGLLAEDYVARTSERDFDTRQLERAEAEFNAGRNEQAIAELKKMKHPSPPARLLQAWASYRIGDTAAGRALFTEVLNEFPDLIDASNGLAYCALRDNDLAGAEKHFQHVIAVDGKNPAALIGLGIAYYRQERNAEARRFLSQGIELDPQNEEAREILAKLPPEK